MTIHDANFTPKEIDSAHNNFLRAKELATQGQKAKAERICTSLISQYPTYFAAHRQLAALLIDKKQYYQALHHISVAVSGDPRDYVSLLTLEGLFAELGMYDAGLALNTMIEAVAMANGVAEHAAVHWFNRGNILLKTLRYSEAAMALERCLAAHPDNYDPALKLVETYKCLGEYHKALRLVEHFLFNVKTKPISFLGLLADVPEKLLYGNIQTYISMAEQAVAEDDDEDTFRWFTLASFYHVERNHTKAWATVCRQNERVKATMPKNGRQDLQQKMALLAWAGKAHFGRPPLDDGQPATLPLYILGPSRSGKTSLETALAWLPGLKRGFENTLLGRAVRCAANAGDRLPSDVLSFLPEPLLSQCVTVYQSLFYASAANAAIFTTTTPGLVASLPVIKYALPRAKFIVLHRDPMDTAMRMYFTYYRKLNVHSYDLDWSLKYIQWYYDLADVWQQKFPDAVLVVSYNDLINTSTATVQTVLNFLGIEADVPSDLRIPGDSGFAEPYLRLMR